MTKLAGLKVFLNKRNNPTKITWDKRTNNFKEWKKNSKKWSTSTLKTSKTTKKINKKFSTLSSMV